MSNELPQDDADSRLPAYPKTVTVAGLIWVTVGWLILLNIMFLLRVRFTAVNYLPPAEQVQKLSVDIAGSICISLFVLVFLLVGTQILSGTSRGAMENGIGSILFSLIYFAVGGSLIVRGMLLSGMITATLATSLLVAGVVAIKGHSDYKAWRANRRSRW